MIIQVSNDLFVSLMYEMRLKVHFELAKISAQLNDLQIAQDNLTKVAKFNYCV